MCAPQAELANDKKLGLSVLRSLIGHGADVTVKDVDGRQPLMWAASSGEFKISKSKFFLHFLQSCVFLT